MKKMLMEVVSVDIITIGKKKYRWTMRMWHELVIGTAGAAATWFSLTAMLIIGKYYM